MNTTVVFPESDFHLSIFFSFSCSPIVRKAENREMYSYPFILKLAVLYRIGLPSNTATPLASHITSGQRRTA